MTIALLTFGAAFGHTAALYQPGCRMAAALLTLALFFTLLDMEEDE